jgi:endonuclease-3
VRTILSQGTNDRNSAAAYQSLRAAFPSWEEVVDAPTREVAAAIAVGGLAAQKAPRIQSAISTLLNGRLDVDLLSTLPLREAVERLTRLDGVGPKTAACVLLFALGRPIVPVDTHVARVMTRIGLVPDHTGTDTKQWILTNMAGPDPESIYAFHVETIDHGRAVCQARDPKCDACLLQDVCQYYRRFQQGMGPPSSG